MSYTTEIQLRSSDSIRKSKVEARDGGPKGFGISFSDYSKSQSFYVGAAACVVALLSRRDDP